MTLLLRLLGADGTGGLIGSALDYLDDRSVTSSIQYVCKQWSCIVADTQCRQFIALQIGEAPEEWRQLYPVDANGAIKLRCGLTRAKLCLKMKSELQMLSEDWTRVRSLLLGKGVHAIGGVLKSFSASKAAHVQHLLLCCDEADCPEKCLEVPLWPSLRCLSVELSSPSLTV